MMLFLWRKGRDLGTITLRKTFLANVRIKARELRHKGDPMRRKLRLNLVMTAPLAISWMPIDLTEEQVDKLANVLEEFRALRAVSTEEIRF